MRSHCLFLLVLFALAGCQDKKPDPILKTPAEPSDAADAPSVRGKIAMPGEWRDESLTAGFVAKAKDGKILSNSCGREFSGPGGDDWMTSKTFEPQLSTISNHATKGLGYEHVRVAPGDYVVYVRRGKVPSAWKRVMVKDGDRLTADLTIDPAKTGGIVVTLPDEEANAKLSLLNSNLFLIPMEFGSETWMRDAFEAGYVEEGNKTVARKGVPAGKYLVLRGKSEAEVEVVAGKESAVTLVRKGAKK